MNIIHSSVLAAMLATLPLAAQAGPGDGTGIQQEVQQDLADARREMRADLASARKELVTGNLQLDGSISFGKHRAKPTAKLPRAEITPQGDLLINGQAQPLDAGQRRQLLAYRGQVVGIALTGIDIGQKSADAALDAVGTSWVGMLFNAMSGRLERRIKRVVAEQVQPAVLALCKQLPAVLDSQQQLASTLPQFRPYATLQSSDIEDCEDDVRNEFASL